MKRALSALFQQLLHCLCHGADLSLAVCGGENKEVREATYVSDIEHGDVCGLLVGGGLNGLSRDVGCFQLDALDQIGVIIAQAQAK